MRRESRQSAALRREEPREADFDLYAGGRRIECVFNKLAYDRAVATCCAKRARNFASLIDLVTSMLWMK